MNESSSIHSATLVSLARSLSGLGLDAANGGPANTSDIDELPSLVCHSPFALERNTLYKPEALQQNTFWCVLFVFFVFFSSNPASIWAQGFTLLMARGKWTTSFATNTKRGGAPSRAFPSRPMEASTYRCWRGWRRKPSLWRPAHP